MKINVVITCVALSIFLSGCSIDRIFGKNAKAESKASDRIVAVDKLISANDKEKLSTVGVLASGTDHALNKVSNKEPAVIVAQDLNNRVISLAGKPNLDIEKEMWVTVDQLTSQVIKERERGIKSLEKKDKEITDIQERTKSLETAKDKEIEKYMKLAADQALRADANKAELDDYKGWMGLKAVAKGLWQFITTSVWILSGVCIVYLVLRAFASTNPIVGAIFGVFEQMASWVIHTVEVAAPRATAIANFIPKSVVDAYKNTLRKLIDTIQLLKDTQKRTGRVYTLDEVLIEISKSMSDEDKSKVEEIKKEIGWN